MDLKSASFQAAVDPLHCHALFPKPDEERGEVSVDRVRLVQLHQLVKELDVSPAVAEVFMDLGLTNVSFLYAVGEVELGRIVMGCREVQEDLSILSSRVWGRVVDIYRSQQSVDKALVDAAQRLDADADAAGEQQARPLQPLSMQGEAVYGTFGVSNTSPIEDRSLFSPRGTPEGSRPSSPAV